MAIDFMHPCNRARAAFPERRLPVTLLGAIFAGLTTCFPVLLMAQPPVRASAASAAAPAPPCSPSASAVTIAIVNAATGAPLRGGEITVHVTHVASGRRLRDATELPIDPPGRWVLLTDGDLKVRSATGDTLAVEVLRSGRVLVKRELRVGLDSAQCHLRLLDAPAAIRVP